jgi:pyruvate,water dikinase
MRQSPFVWLGSGRARKREVPAKWAHLDEAAQSGLPVPAGGILLDDFYQICLAAGVVEIIAGEIVTPDPIWLQEVIFRDVRFPRLKQAVAVRTAGERHTAKSQPMERTTLNVDLTNARQMAAALRMAWSAVPVSKKAEPRAVMIMEMVDVLVIGRAITDRNQLMDQTTLIRGDGCPAHIELDQLGVFQRTDNSHPPYFQRLQKLLRGVRRTFGKGQWQVEWADDGRICWILQIDQLPNPH